MPRLSNLVIPHINSILVSYFSIYVYQSKRVLNSPRDFIQYLSSTQFDNENVTLKHHQFYLIPVVPFVFMYNNHGSSPDFHSSVYFISNLLTCSCRVRPITVY